LNGTSAAGTLEVTWNASVFPYLAVVHLAGGSCAVWLDASHFGTGAEFELAVADALGARTIVVRS
jgi:hypothetical protein